MSNASISVTAKIFALALAAYGSSIAVAQPAETNEVAEAENINAVLRTATIYVRDWDASMKFYAGYLGYKVISEAPITSKKSLKVIGAKAGMTARIAYLKPASDRLARPFAGNYLGLIEFKGAEFDTKFDRPAGDASAIRSEIVLSHQVQGIDKIYAAMVADGITIITPLGLSGAKLSRSFGAIDPNGIRVEMYEYIEGKEPAKNP